MNTFMQFLEWGGSHPWLFVIFIYVVAQVIVSPLKLIVWLKSDDEEEEIDFCDCNKLNGDFSTVDGHYCDECKLEVF